MEEEYSELEKELVDDAVKRFGNIDKLVESFNKEILSKEEELHLLEEKLATVEDQFELSIQMDSLRNQIESQEQMLSHIYHYYNDTYKVS